MVKMQFLGEILSNFLKLLSESQSVIRGFVSVFWFGLFLIFNVQIPFRWLYVCVCVSRSPSITMFVGTKYLKAKTKITKKIPQIY